MLRSQKTISISMAWLIWFVAALFYFYEYILRSAPSVMVPQLAQFFSTDAAGIGLLIGFYYYSYAPLQLAAGFLFDHFGAQYILPLAVLLCPIGCFLFSMPHFYLASIGRLLIGAGSGFAFTGIIYIAAYWIPKKNHAFAIGATQTLGMLGGIVGQTGVAAVLPYIHWQTLWQILAGIGLLLFILLLGTIPSQPRDPFQPQLSNDLVRNLGLTLKNKIIWQCGFLGGFMFAPTIIFALLWGPTFFILDYSVTALQAAFMNTLVLLGWAVGSPLMGWLADKFHNRKVLLTTSSAIILILFLLIAYTKIFSFTGINIMMFLLGLFSGAQILCFAIAKDSNPSYLQGSSIGATNFLIFLWAAILTPLSGALLHFYHGHALAAFSLTEFRHALLIVIVCLILAIIIAAYLPKEES